MAEALHPNTQKALDDRLAELAEGFRPHISREPDTKQTKAVEYIAYALGELLKEVRQLRAALEGEATARLR